MKNAYKTPALLATAASLVLLGLSAGASAQTTDPAPVQPAVPPVTAPVTAPAVAEDANAAKDFMREAFMANEFSIAASQLAATQGEDPDVKAAAQAVLDNGLKTRAAMVTAIQGSTSDMHFDQNFTDDYTTKLGELKVAQGADFDTKYVAAQGAVNDKAEDVFKAYATTGTDESVKTFAANTLPVLAANGDKLDAVSQGGN